MHGDEVAFAPRFLRILEIVTLTPTLSLEGRGRIQPDPGIGVMHGMREQHFEHANPITALHRPAELFV